MHFAAVMWRWLAVGGHMGAGRGREPSGDRQTSHRAGVSADRRTTWTRTGLWQTRGATQLLKNHNGVDSGLRPWFVWLRSSKTPGWKYSDHLHLGDPIANDVPNSGSFYW